MRLLQLNDRMINMDQVTLIERKDGGTVWVRFVDGTKNGTDVPLNAEESTKLWGYLLNQSQDLME